MDQAQRASLIGFVRRYLLEELLFLTEEDLADDEEVRVSALAPAPDGTQAVHVAIPYATDKGPAWLGMSDMEVIVRKAPNEALEVTSMVVPMYIVQEAEQGELEEEQVNR